MSNSNEITERLYSFYIPVNRQQMTTTDDQRATMYVGNNKETVITENIRNMTLWNECMSVRLQTGVNVHRVK